MFSKHLWYFTLPLIGLEQLSGQFVWKDFKPVSIKNAFRAYKWTTALKADKKTESQKHFCVADENIADFHKTTLFLKTNQTF